MGSEVDSIPRIRQVFYATYALLPITGVAIGDLGFATDRLVLYRWSGAAWVALTIYCSSGLLSARPNAANLPDGSLYFGTNTAMLYQVQAGAWATIISSITTVAIEASDTLRNSNDTEKPTVSAVYVKLKEVRMNAALAGCRIKFDLMTTPAMGETAYARIYKNGVAIGTEQSEAAGVYTTVIDDLTGFALNDLIQIYAKNSAGTAFVRNMRFYYSEYVTTIGTKGLVTHLATITDPTISMTNQDP